MKTFSGDRVKNEKSDGGCPREGRAHLNDDFHEVLLRDHVLAVDDLFEYRGQDRPLVQLQPDAFQLAQPDEVRADEDPQLAPFEFPSLLVPRESLVLQPDPELVHLDKVCQDEPDRVFESSSPSRFFAAVADRQVVARHAREVVPQEQASGRVLDPARHLHHVLHDLLYGRARDRHVDRADRDHEVQPRDNVARVLDEFVQVGEVVFALHVRVVQVRAQMSQRVEHGHVFSRKERSQGTVRFRGREM